MQMDLDMQKIGNTNFRNNYLTERAEEQRSKLAQIKSSLQHLSQNIDAIQTTYNSISISPPILYSNRIFIKNVRLIDKLTKLLKKINIDSDYETLILNDKILIKCENNLICALIGFQQLHDQRISGLHSMKSIEFQHILQSEYNFIGKVYNAVDALSYNLMENCFGKKWIRKTHYTPVSLFGLNYAMLPLEYALLPPLKGSLELRFEITGPGSLIIIPYYDCFRARFWPSLAHEVGHIAVALAKDHFPLLYMRKEAEIYYLKKIFSNNTDDSLLSIYIWNNKSLNYYISMQLGEIISDIVSAYICGPASFFSASTLLQLSNWSLADDFFVSILQNNHPPIEIRLTAMLKTLELLEIPSCNLTFAEVAEGTQKSLKNIKSINQNGSETPFGKQIYSYNEEIAKFAEKVVLDLRNEKLVPFNGEKWIEINESIKKTGSLDGLKPIELINIAWAARFKKTKCDCTMDNEHMPHTNKIFEKRQGEKKLFETLVHCMYSYYEKEVVNKFK
jgi:hypothetical protein